MTKRQFFAAAIAAAAVTVAGVAGSGTSAQAKVQVEKPFRLVSEGTIANETGLDCDLDLSGEPVLLCGQEFAGVDERATHLGRTTSTGTGVLTLYVTRPPCTTPEGNPGAFCTSPTRTEPSSQPTVTSCTSASTRQDAATGSA